MFDFRELDIPIEDLKYAPEDMVKAFLDRLTEYSKRVNNLVDTFAVVIYKVHVSGAINSFVHDNVMHDGGKYVKDLVENAEPEKVHEKAINYATQMTSGDASALKEIAAEIRVVVKRNKGKSHASN